MSKKYEMLYIRQRYSVTSEVVNVLEKLLKELYDGMSRSLEKSQETNRSKDIPR